MLLKRFSLPFFALLLSAVLIGGAFVTVDVYAVDTCAVPSAGYASIQLAVDDPFCEAVKIAAGVYNENVVIDRSVMIGGAGSGATTVDGGGSGRVFEIPYDAGQDLEIVIFDLKITNGDAGVALYGGGVYNEETVTLDDVLVQASSADSGGGVANGDHGVLIVVNSQVNGNSAASDGGNIYNTGVMTISNSQASNAAGGFGGVYSEGPLAILGSQLDGNSDGGLYHRDAPLVMADSSLDGNISYGI